jgi:3-oxoacyl-[acyl-carrier protein] reductase
MSEHIFQGKVAVITGAGQGIGFEIARQLCAQGASVILNDKNPQLAETASNLIRKVGGTCIPLAGDAADPVFIQKLTDTALEKFGGLHIAIANAGITLFGDFFTYPQESLQQVMNLNMGGSFLLAQSAAIQMRKQGKGGSILLMSSVTGHQAHRHLAAYAMTKAALEMMARNLVIELSPFNITINAIAPGATLTERTLTTDPEYDKIWSELTPMGKPATTADIAHAALFLVSPLSHQITGQTLLIDGGWSVVSPSPGDTHFKKVGRES